MGVALVLAGCDETGNTDNSCTADSECVIPGTRCGPQGQCICAADEACASDQFCNSAGVCQTRTGCAITADCAEGTFCDIASGLCLDDPGQPGIGSPCGLSSQCAYGTVCRDGTCQDGCFTDGDCPLGQVCLEGFCFTGGPGQTICSDSEFCEYGAVCDSDNICRDDRRGPYCRGCSPRTSMNPNPCDDPRNFCLINSFELGGFTNFCGVDCSLGQPCPSGYGCNNVIVLTDAVCLNTAQCRCDANEISFASAACSVSTPCQPTLPGGQPDPDATQCVFPGSAACNGGTAGGAASCVVPRGQTEGNCTCAADADCPNGGACVAGLCCGGAVRPEEDLRCVVGEGRVSGFCTCATDDDCGNDSCDPSSGSCRITGIPCTPGNGDCPPIACINGGCLIGQNCAPQQGLTCSEVTDR
ncbi:MAG: hypothetical protein AAFZ18_31970 [Myxococcota bacterium]